MGDGIPAIDPDALRSSYPPDPTREAVVGWTFSEPYRIAGSATVYRDLIHPDGVVAGRHSVEGLIRHGSVLLERTPT